jgi:DHA1 family bicyclomycin/chloramphenicol resistance-like MFS transporter
VAPTIEVLIAARCLQAIGGAAGIVLSRAIVRDLYGREKSASVLGYITMAWVIAPMLAPSLGGLLDGVAGWRASFFFISALGALVWLAALRLLHETHFERQSLPGLSGWLSGYRDLLRAPGFLSYALTLGFTSSVFFSFLGGAPYVMVVVLGRTPLDYGLWFIMVSFGYMIGNGLAGRFSERIGIDRMIGLGTTLALLGALACLLAAVTGLLSPLAIFGPMLLVAIGNGLAIPNGTAAAISINPVVAGTASGLAGFLQMGLGALTSQSVGLLQDSDPFAVFYVMAGGAGLAVLLHRLAQRRRPVVCPPAGG